MNSGCPLGCTACTVTGGWTGAAAGTEMSAKGLELRVAGAAVGAAKLKSRSLRRSSADDGGGGGGAASLAASGWLPPPPLGCALSAFEVLDGLVASWAVAAAVAAVPGAGTGSTMPGSLGPAMEERAAAAAGPPPLPLPLSSLPRRSGTPFCRQFSGPSRRKRGGTCTHQTTKALPHKQPEPTAHCAGCLRAAM
jgi:hypothetical protein